jgi:rhodanese-related sulfurtransferase
MNVIEITPAELMERKNTAPAHLPIHLIDVRTPVEFQEMHVSFANLVPLDTLTPKLVEEKFKGTDPVYVVCRSGSRGKKACETLLASGCANVFNIQGGTLACAQAGLPITHGKKVMSLERQVRIAAGFLVALGSLLGFFVDPRLGFLSTFVGCGLMFAGVTDTCGMGMMLAKMPWNRVANNPSCHLPKTTTNHS